MAKINTEISAKTEESLNKMAWLDRTKTREKGKRIDFVVAIAREFYEHVDNETFLQITGYEK